MKELPKFWCVPATNYRAGAFFNDKLSVSCYTSFKNGFLNSHNRKGECILTGGDLGCSFHSCTLEKKYVILSNEEFDVLVLGMEPHSEVNDYSEMLIFN